MKKLNVSVVFLLVACLILSACGTSASSEGQSTSFSGSSQNDSAQSAKDQKSSGKIATVTIGGKVFEMDLYDNPSAQELIKTLPITITASRWGDGEYYGEIPKQITSKGEKRDSFAVGEVGLWPEGNSFCIFFGPTPVSSGKQPKMDSPGIPLGKITSHVSALEKMDASVKVTVKLKQ